VDGVDIRVVQLILGHGHPITDEAEGRQFIALSVGAPGQAPKIVALARRR
jgi:hypothetical protein